MSWVIFLRGANVGGHRTFQPSAFAKDLAEFDMANVGAAGTFVARAKVPQSRLRREIVQRLPFETEVLICPVKEIQELVRSDPFEPISAPSGSKPFLTVLVGPPKQSPDIPLSVPKGPSWEVQLVAVRERYVFSLSRRLGPRIIYPNSVVERSFGVRATTRGWPTVVAVAKILAAS
jgi:uncharacterized protein (DUF1697 family)